VSSADLTPPFELLVKAYFNEDWDYEGADTREIMANIVAGSECSFVEEIRADAAHALERYAADRNQLASLLDTWGFAYEPEREGLDHYEWLELVVRLLSEPRP
jgi:hypothetical protein